MTQAHDYKAALENLRSLDCHTEDAFNDLENAQVDAAQFIVEHIDTIRHALAMMAKLQEPSEGMLETMKQIIWNNAWSRENCQINIARLLKQAEEEIK